MTKASALWSFWWSVKADQCMNTVYCMYILCRRTGRVLACSIIATKSKLSATVADWLGGCEDSLGVFSPDYCPKSGNDYLAGSQDSRTHVKKKTNVQKTELFCLMVDSHKCCSHCRHCFDGFVIVSTADWRGLTVPRVACHDWHAASVKRSRDVTRRKERRPYGRDPLAWTGAYYVLAPSPLTSDKCSLANCQPLTGMLDRFKVMFVKRCEFSQVLSHTCAIFPRYFSVCWHEYEEKKKSLT